MIILFQLLRNGEVGRRSGRAVVKMARMQLLVVVALLVASGRAYFADWSLLARDRQPTCVDIPANMTLCQNIGQ